MTTAKIAFALLWSLALTAISGKENALQGEIIWELDVDGHVMATAALDEDCVYFGTISSSKDRPESTFYCLARADGKERWSRPFPDWLQACPVVTPTRVFVACRDSKLYCLDKRTGDELWHVDTFSRLDSTPCVDTPGNCYFGSRDRHFYAVDPKGNILWKHLLTGEVASSPVLHEREGRLYVADKANTIYAFSLMGNAIWSRKPRQGNIDGVHLRIYSSPALDDDRFLYVGSGDHHLYAIDRSTGLLFWQDDTGGKVDSSPVISQDGFLYVANRQGALFKYNIDRLAIEREVWRAKDIGQVFYGSPTVDAENNIYICGAPPNPGGEPLTQLSYLDKHTGEILWSARFSGYTDATPALDEEGNVYFGTAAGRFFKVRGAGCPLADAPWPTFHGAPSGHGRHEEMFTQWLASHQIPQELASSGRDSDKDGFPDYEEFVHGTNPKDFLERPTGGIEVIALRGAESILAFHLQKGIRAPHGWEVTSHLSSWHPLSLGPEDYRFEDLGTRWRVVVTLEGSMSSMKFFRVAWRHRTSPNKQTKERVLLPSRH